MWEIEFKCNSESFNKESWSVYGLNIDIDNLPSLDVVVHSGHHGLQDP